MGLRVLVISWEQKNGLVPDDIPPTLKIDPEEQHIVKHFVTPLYSYDCFHQLLKEYFHKTKLLVISDLENKTYNTGNVTTIAQLGFEDKCYVH